MHFGSYFTFQEYIDKYDISKKEFNNPTHFRKFEELGLDPNKSVQTCNLSNDGFKVDNLFGTCQSKSPIKKGFKYKFVIKITHLKSISARIGFSPIVASFEDSILSQGGFGVANQASGLNPNILCLWKNASDFTNVGLKTLVQENYIQISVDGTQVNFKVENNLDATIQRDDLYVKDYYFSVSAGQKPAGFEIIEANIENLED